MLHEVLLLLPTFYIANFIIANGFQQRRLRDASNTTALSRRTFTFTCTAAAAAFGRRRCAELGARNIVFDGCVNERTV